jgi:hypothetical protein
MLLPTEIPEPFSKKGYGMQLLLYICLIVLCVVVGFLCNISP